MNPVIIIPARRASTRIPDKMLLDIKGKPLIRWTVEAAKRTGLPVTVATDCKEIAWASTADHVWIDDVPHFNGTERCIAAWRGACGNSFDLLINWQGDSPMTKAVWAIGLAHAMAHSPCAVGTMEQHVGREAHDGEVEVIHGNQLGFAASFGRCERGDHLTYRHVGLYAIKPEAFSIYGRAPGFRELVTGLEQMRWIERGVAIAAVEVPDEPAFEINHDLDVGLFKTCLESIDETV